MRKGPVSHQPEESGKKWEKTKHSFLWGLIPTTHVKAYQVCAESSWQSVTISRSFGHIIVSFLTLGLYVPISVTLICLPSLPQSPVDEFQELENLEKKEELEEEELLNQTGTG